MIAFHSPDGAHETGLLRCLTEKKAETPADGTQRGTFSGPVLKQELRNYRRFPTNFKAIEADFLLVERVEIELSLELLELIKARTCAGRIPFCNNNIQSENRARGTERRDQSGFMTWRRRMPSDCEAESNTNLWRICQVRSG